MGWYLSHCYWYDLFKAVELTNGVINRLGYRYRYRGPHLLNIVVLVVADGLFGHCRLERLDKLFMNE